MAVSSAVTSPTTHITVAQKWPSSQPYSKARHRISSFEKKPESTGTPAMASVATRNVQRVNGR